MLVFFFFFALDSSYISLDIIFKICLHYLQDAACACEEIVYSPFGGLSHSEAAFQYLV